MPRTSDSDMTWTHQDSIGNIKGLGYKVSGQVVVMLHGTPCSKTVWASTNICTSWHVHTRQIKGNINRHGIGTATVCTYLNTVFSPYHGGHVELEECSLWYEHRCTTPDQVPELLSSVSELWVDEGLKLTGIWQLVYHLVTGVEHVVHTRHQFPVYRRITMCITL